MEERGYNHKRGGTSLCEFVNSVWHEISQNVVTILQLRQVGTWRELCNNIQWQHVSRNVSLTTKKYWCKFRNIAELPSQPPSSSSSSSSSSYSLPPSFPASLESFFTLHFLDSATSVFIAILAPRFHLPKLHILVLIIVLYIAPSSVLPCDDQCNSRFRILPFINSIWPYNLSVLSRILIVVSQTERQTLLSERCHFFSSFLVIT